MNIKRKSAISSTIIVVVIVVVILVAAAGVYVAVSAKPASTVTVTSGITATITSGTTATITSGTTATSIVTTSSTSTLSTLSPPQSVVFTTPSSGSFSYLVGYTAANGGFCSQLGLDLTYTPSPSTPSLGSEMAANEVQFADVSLTSSLTLVNESVPMTAIGLDTAPEIFSLAISNTSTITSVSQLKGTGFTVAGNGPGASDLALRFIAAQYGLTVGASGSGADIIDVNVGTAPAATTSVITGATKGADNSFLTFFPYVLAGDLKILANYTLPENVLLASNSEIAHSPNVVRTFLQCYYDASTYLASNETYAAQMAVQLNPADTPQVTKDLFSTFFPPNLYTPTMGNFTSTILQQFDSFRTAFIAAPGGGSVPTVAQLITTQFVPVTIFHQTPSG